MCWAGTYFTYFQPTRVVHVQTNAESLVDDWKPAKDGAVRKMSGCDLVATVCLSQRRFSTFVLISGQCEESAPLLWSLRGTPLPDEDDEQESSAWFPPSTSLRIKAGKLKMATIDGLLEASPIRALSQRGRWVLFLHLLPADFSRLIVQSV